MTRSRRVEPLWKWRFPESGLGTTTLGGQLRFWNSLLIAWDKEGRVFALDPAGGKILWTYEAAKAGFPDPFHSDLHFGERLLLLSVNTLDPGPSGLIRLDVRGASRVLMKSSGRGAGCLSGDGAVHLSREEYVRLNLDDGSILQRVRGDYRPDGLWAHAAGGAIAASVSGEYPKEEVVVVDAATGRVLSRQGHDTRFRHPEEWAADGLFVAIPCEDRTLALLEMKEGVQLRRVSGPAWAGQVVVGKGRAYWVAQSAGGEQDRDLVAYDLASGRILHQAPLPLEAWTLGLVEDRVIAAGRGLAVFTLSELLKVSVLHDTRLAVEGVSGDGDHLAVVSDPDRVMVFRRAEGEGAAKPAARKQAPLRKSEAQPQPPPTEAAAPELIDRCRRVLKEYAATGLVPAGTSAETTATLAGQEGVPKPLPQTSDFDLYLLSFACSRVARLPDPTSLYAPDIFDRFLERLVAAASADLGKADVESFYDAEEGRVEATVWTAGRASSFSFVQEAAVANLPALLAGLNRLVKKTPRRFYLLDSEGNIAGFLDRSEVQALRRLGHHPE